VNRIDGLSVFAWNPGTYRELFNKLLLGGIIFPDPLVVITHLLHDLNYFVVQCRESLLNYVRSASQQLERALCFMRIIVLSEGIIERLLSRILVRQILVVYIARVMRPTKRGGEAIHCAADVFVAVRVRVEDDTYISLGPIEEVKFI
jgi:hypothetical protein